MPNKNTPLSILFSIPTVEKLDLPPRAEMLAGIESGEIEHIDFRAKVFKGGMNANQYVFRTEDLPAFAASFEGQPFLRDHETEEIDARDGTILSSFYDGESFVQDIRITTRRGMSDYVEGRIDRFSIGWFYDDCICSICNSSYLGGVCNHFVGGVYQTQDGEQTCMLIFINPRGKETSAVNVPAVEGTGIITQLSQYKGILLGEELARLKQTHPSHPSGQAPVAAETDALLEQRAIRTVRLETAKHKPYEGVITMNLREQMKARAGKLELAEALANKADAENRDFSDAERDEFNALLSEAETLDAQITTQLAEREKLKAALNKNYQAEPEKPNAPAPAKLMKRDAFNQLSVSEQAAYVRNGGKIED